MRRIRTCIWAIWCSFPVGPGHSVSASYLTSCRATYETALPARQSDHLGSGRRPISPGCKATREAAIAGGKSRRIPGFDYSPDGSVSTNFQVIGPRTTRPDGRKPFIPRYPITRRRGPTATSCLISSSRLPVSTILFRSLAYEHVAGGDGVAGLDGGAAVPPRHATRGDVRRASPSQISGDLGNRRRQCTGDCKTALIAATKAGRSRRWPPILRPRSQAGG